MKKRAIIIHGWEGYPEEGWFPWLKKELENNDFEVSVPQMPNTNEPKFNEWFEKITEIIGGPNEQAFLIGHSLGCITILRYLESLDENKKIGGVVLVAGFPEPIGYDEIISFLNKTVDYEKIKLITKNIIAIHSDNDKYVSLKNGELLRDNLGAELIVEKNQGHFSGSDGVVELPVVLTNILKISK